MFGFVGVAMDSAYVLLMGRGSVRQPLQRRPDGEQVAQGKAACHLRVYGSPVGEYGQNADFAVLTKDA